MRGKIILEEHVCLPDQDLIPGLSRASRNGSDLFQALVDLHGERLQEMNANGVEYAIISQSPAGPQGIHNQVEAERFAVKSNNYIADLVGKAPERFGAFACLSMHDPEVAAQELVRCVETLGMLGAMLHGGQEFIGDDGQVDEFYYDEPRYEPFWDKVEGLGVPIYLHPKNPLPRDMRLFKTRPWLLGPTYSFARDASFQALALFTSGLFDKHPRVKIILGHMGMCMILLSPFAYGRVQVPWLTYSRGNDSQSLTPNGPLAREEEPRAELTISEDAPRILRAEHLRHHSRGFFNTSLDPRNHGDRGRKGAFLSGYSL